MRYTILIHCPDQSGIISAITGFIHNNGGNIVYLDQHVDEELNVFFMRLESEFTDSEFEFSKFQQEFDSKLAIPYAMEWNIHPGNLKPRMAIFVSKYNHCLYDLLSRYKSGELTLEIPFILSNHDDGYKAASKAFETTFGKIPVPKRNGGSIPIVPLFEEELGSKSILMGFGLDSNAIHSPNEHFGVWNYLKGIETIPYFYKYYSELMDS